MTSNAGSAAASGLRSSCPAIIECAFRSPELPPQGHVPLATLQEVSYSTPFAIFGPLVVPERHAVKLLWRAAMNHDVCRRFRQALRGRWRLIFRPPFSTRTISSLAGWKAGCLDHAWTKHVVGRKSGRLSRNRRMQCVADDRGSSVRSKNPSRKHRTGLLPSTLR